MSWGYEALGAPRVAGGVGAVSMATCTDHSSQQFSTLCFPFHLRKVWQNCRLRCSGANLLLWESPAWSLDDRRLIERLGCKERLEKVCCCLACCCLLQMCDEWHFLFLRAGTCQMFAPQFPGSVGQSRAAWAVKVCVCSLLGTYGLKQSLRIKAWLYWNEWQNSHSLWIVKMICRAP